MLPHDSTLASWVTGLCLAILSLSGLLAAVCLKRAGVPLTPDFLLACASPVALLGFSALLLLVLGEAAARIERA
jgi:hypothetical protein